MSIDNGYCTLGDLKAVLRIVDNVDDAMLEARIEEASRVIDDYCDRRFYVDATATDRVYVAPSSSYVLTDDISSTTGLVVKIDTGGDGSYSTTLSASQYQVEPLNAVSKGMSITRIVATTPGSFPTTNAPAPIKVTAVWGWPAIPYPVKSACILLAGRLTKRGDSLLGVAGFGDLGAITVRNIDPDVQRMLAPYKTATLA
jgi:hypothetical protein